MPLYHFPNPHFWHCKGLKYHELRENRALIHLAHFVTYFLIIVVTMLRYLISLNCTLI